MKAQLEKVINGIDLSYDEAHQVMLKIMSGEVNNSQIAAYLTALKSKGEHFYEIAGSARAMRDKSVKIESVSNEVMVDVCGTGGDGSGTFNISTAVAFVIAGVGIKVAKHGNRSISSKSGSADVLRELGVNISLPAKDSEKALHEVGITFLFAPEYHPAMKYVAPVRRELAMKTIFNVLGPLTNPAGAQRQIIGTFNNQVAEKMVKALEYLEMEKVCFLCTDDCFDEITLTGPAQVFEYNPEEIKNYTLNFEEFGYPIVKIEDLSGDTPEHNARLVKDLFTSGKKDAKFYVTAANAAMGLYVAGYSDSLQDCLKAAEYSLIAGKANQKLEQLVEFGQ
jgi:anthranilate phosphoribosyltransferase